MPRTAERAGSRVAALVLAAVLAGCATEAPRSTRPAAVAAAPAAPGGAAVLGRTPHVLVVRAGPGDDATSLARRFLGDPAQAWRVAALDGGVVREGVAAALSLDAADPGLAAAARYVPILCYHRFTEGRSGSLMEVSGKAFDAQLDWLHDNGWTVAPLSAVADFVNGGRPLPPKVVAITIDDGYRSALQVALPILKRHGAPATLFVPSDFPGAGDALSWAELTELRREPLVDVQPHSKTHADMVKRLPGETAAAYARRRADEVSAPTSVFGKRFAAAPAVFAYPFGSADPQTVEEVRRAGYRAAVTVARGGNAPWAPPYLLRRDMIYGADDLATFGRRVEAAARGPVSGPRETEQ